MSRNENKMVVMGKKKKNEGRMPALGLRFDPVLVELIKSLAESNRRSITAEVSIALEERLAKFGMWPPKEEKE